MKQEIANLIAKNFSGEIAPEERTVLQEWLNDKKENEEGYNNVKCFFEKVNEFNKVLPNDYSTNQEWELLQQKIETDQPHHDSTIGYVRKQPWPLIAASVIVAIFISVIAFHYIKESETMPSLAIAQSDSVITMAPLQQIQINSDKDSTTSVTLPDGSRVILNHNSSIVYLDDFKTNRNLELKGEAYFEVIHDSLHPFVVNCGNLEILDLGTEFNINGRDQNHIRVDVHSGKVLVSDKNKKISPLELKRHESTEYKHHTKTFKKEAIKNNKKHWWKNKKREGKFRTIIRKIINKLKRKKN